MDPLIFPIELRSSRTHSLVKHLEWHMNAKECRIIMIMSILGIGLGTQSESLEALSIHFIVYLVNRELLVCVH